MTDLNIGKLVSLVDLVSEAHLDAAVSGDAKTADLTAYLGCDLALLVMGLKPLMKWWDARMTLTDVLKVADRRTACRSLDLLSRGNWIPREMFYEFRCDRDD